MPRMNRLSSYATTVSADASGITRVVYHSTEIVAWNADRSRILLRTGGYDTVTTRRKMNQAARQFGLPYSVYRDKGRTYVAPDSGYRVARFDGSPIRNGVVPFDDDELLILN